MKKFIFLMIGVMFLLITPTMIVSANTGSTDDHTFFTNDGHTNDNHNNDDHNNGSGCDKKCTGETKETRSIDCAIGYSGSITETRTKSSYPACAWGEWVETANTCIVNTYSVTPSAGDNGTISPNVPQTVNYNQTTSFTVTPSVGYIATVGGNCGGNLVNGIYTTSNITKDCTVTASFEKAPVDNFTVTALAVGHGTITPATMSAIPGSTVNFTVTPEAGYATSDFTGTCPLGTLNGTIWTTGNITADCNVTANFTKIPDQTFSVTASAVGHGTITPATQTAISGSTVNFTVTADAGYSVAMSGDCPAGILEATSYTTGNITADCTVIATFTKIPDGSYTLTVEAAGTGHGVTTGTGTYTSGTVVTATATANGDSTFSGWSENCPGGVVTVTGNTTCTANFTLNSVETFTVTASAGTNGSITPASQVTATGTTVIFTVTPNDSYKANIDGNCPAGNLVNNTYTTGNIVSNCTVIATFTKIDMCPNIVGDQTSIPSGKYINRNGDCVNRSSGGGSTGGSIPVKISQPGQVLGESTTCGIYVDKYLRKGLKGNDKNAVIKIQQFLNDYMGSGLVIDGIFGTKTDIALKNFQAKQYEKVLAPWGLQAPTGIFYLTTQTEVNNIMCPPLNLPIPTLVPIDQNPSFPQF